MEQREIALAAVNEPGESSEAGTGIPRRLTLVSLGILLPAAVIALYMLSGTDAIGPVADRALPAHSITVGQTAQAFRPETLPSVEAMLARLEQRLEQEPGDARGWELLGRSYDHLGHSDAAEKAYARALELGYERRSRPVNNAAVVQGTVSLDPSLTHGVSATDTVFILARAVYGPRMPLAVLRKPAVELPISYRLDDSMAMSAGLKLSDYRDVIVSARISASGDASAGSLEGYSGVVHPGQDATVNIVVDQEPILVPAPHRAAATGGNS
jgi:hypothetical protein